MDDHAPDEALTPATAREALHSAIDQLTDAAVLELWALGQAWVEGADEEEC
jgi:hypothetical protein